MTLPFMGTPTESAEVCLWGCRTKLSFQIGPLHHADDMLVSFLAFIAVPAILQA